MSTDTAGPVRVAEEDLVAFARAVNRHFHESEEDDDVLPWVEAFTTGYRAWWTRVDGRVAGNLGIIETSVSVPGGAHLPVAAVTAVGVAQTMRRRGLLRALMVAALDEAVERGEPVAALFASEAGIYGRFGFGAAVPHVSYRIERGRVRFRDPVDVRQVVATDPAAARQAWPTIHAAMRSVRGGSVARHPGLWDLSIIQDPPGWRGGASARRLVEVPGRGYAAYRVLDSSDGLLATGTLQLLELVATDPDAEAALWQHVLDVDLTATVEAALRPVDDALPHLVSDAYVLRAAVAEPLFLRVLDTPRTLTARRYAASGRVVLEVVDDLGHAGGRWALEVDAGGAACEPTEAPAALRLPVESLSAVVLGGVTTSTLLAARRAEELREGAAVELDRLLAVDRSPWTTSIF